MIDDAVTVVALAETLTRTEATAQAHGGWDDDPVLLGLFQHPTSNPRDLFIQVDPSLFGPRAWRLPDPANPGHLLEVGTVLELMTQTLATPPAHQALRGWLDPTNRTFLGFALLFVGRHTETSDPHRRGDLNAAPAAVDGEVRVVAGLDITDRYYQISRRRGQPEPTVTVLAPAPAGLRHTTIGAALTRLVKLAHPTSHHNGHQR